MVGGEGGEEKPSCSCSVVVTLGSCDDKSDGDEWVG